MCYLNQYLPLYTKKGAFDDDACGLLLTRGAFLYCALNNRFLRRLSLYRSVQ